METILTDDKSEIDIEDTESTEEEAGIAPPNFEIVNFPADMTLSLYQEQWKNGQLQIPDFQRKYVWSQAQASKLIESFLLGLPVPGVFLYKGRDSTHYLVIDGHQRIKTIVDFLEGKSKLKAVSSKWNGKSFGELTNQDQFELQTTVMRATIIQELSSDDNTSIYYIFERINTGAVKLTPMEVRLCVYEGSLTKLLRDLNIDPEWRILIAKKEEDKRANDMEFLLRVLALHEKPNNYAPPMKKFLNEYIATHKNASDEWISKKRKLLEIAFNKATLLPKKPFHPKGTVNYAAMDAIMVALMDTKISKKEELNKAYNKLINDEKFKVATSISTSDKSNVLARIKRAKYYFS